MRGFLAVVAAWLIVATPCAAQLSLLGVGPGGAAGGGGGGGLGAPFLLGGGTELDITAGTHPTLATGASCPIGGVVMAAVLNDGDGGAVLTGYSDSAGNSYSVGATPVDPYGGAAPARFAIYASSILTTALASGATVGPNLTASTHIYTVAVCFPGVTTLDPQAPSLTGMVSGNPITATVPSNAAQPQYAAFASISTGHGDVAQLTAPYTDVGLSSGMNTDFGVRFWVAQITTTGSSTTLTATTSNPAGVLSGVGQRTVQ